jgi:nucleoside-diphosphate-sugar epimerase
MMGFSLADKFFAVIGDGRLVLPLVFIDNLCSAIIAAMTHEKSTGKIYNVVDPDPITKRDYMAELVKRLHPGARTVYVPYRVLTSIVFAQEKAFQILNRRPFLTRYRLNSSQNPIVYDSSKITQELGWQPPVSTREAFAGMLEYETRKG